MIVVLPRGAYHNILQQRFLLGDVVVGESDGDRAGFSVSLPNDGTTLAVVRLRHQMAICPAVEV
jgi:hypothetical protein